MSYDSEDFVTLVERRGGLQRLTPLQEFANFLADILPSTPGTYADEDARDAIGAALVAGTGISISINDGADTITITCSITQYTDGMADARVTAGIATHNLDADPHPSYLTTAEGNAAYATISHDHDADYEPLGAVASAISTHEAAVNPHPTYLTQAEGDALYAAITVTQYTDELVDDRVSNLIQNGTGITWSYNDGAGTLTPTVTITQYTDGMADTRAAAAIATHVAAGDPHTQYLLEIEFNLSTFDTDDLSEGATNKYYTTQRASGAALANNLMLMGC